MKVSYFMVTPGRAQAFTVSTRPRSSATPAKPSLDGLVALIRVIALSTRMALSTFLTQAPPILALVVHPMITHVVELAGAIGVEHGRRMVLLKVEGRARLPCGGELLVEELGLGLNAVVLVVVPWVPPV